MQAPILVIFSRRQSAHFGEGIFYVSCNVVHACRDDILYVTRPNGIRESHMGLQRGQTRFAPKWESTAQWNSRKTSNGTTVLICADVSFVTRLQQQVASHKCTTATESRFVFHTPLLHWSSFQLCRPDKTRLGRHVSRPNTCCRRGDGVKQ